jgi:hypothetical protein
MDRFATGPHPCAGRIAQLVEQLTLNQRVPGSSPGAPTNQTKEIRFGGVKFGGFRANTGITIKAIAASTIG